MAKVFLDTNYLIDSIHRRPEKQILNHLLNHIVYTSSLSFHIYCYVFKIKLPNKNIFTQMQKFQITDFTLEILEKALTGPTADLEDNIQLHSAANADCDFFLTQDKKLLRLKFFGKTQLIPALK